MDFASRIAVVLILALLIAPARANARGGYHHHASFDAEHGTTADFLAAPCASFTDVCRSAVSTGVSSHYWGCALIRDQGVDEKTAAKAVYDWLRSNKARSSSAWSADLDVAFRAVYPLCQEDKR